LASKQRLSELAALAVAAFFCLHLGALLFTSFIVALFWDHHVVVMGLFCLIYLAVGTSTAAVIRKRVRSRPKLFAATLTELAKDQQHPSS